VFDFDDKIAVLALRKGLLKGLLHFEACKHTFSTLREFVTFANAYIQDEEDAYSSEEDKRQGHQTPPRQNYNGRSRQNRRGRQPHLVAQLSPTSRYLSSTGEARQLIYNTYHSLNKPREEILREIRVNPNLRFPSRLEVFEIKDPARFCEFHNNKGHDTRDCIALKDELERLAQDKNVWAFIQRFVTNYVWKSDVGRAKLYDNRRP
jgi:hypothetical protein